MAEQRGGGRVGGEDVERGAGLVVDHPEHGGGHEEPDVAAHPGLLGLVEVLVPLDPGEVDHRDGDAGDRQRPDHPVHGHPAGQRDHGEEDDGHGQPERRLAQHRGLLGGRDRRGHHVAAGAEVPGAEQVLHQAQRHADTGQREAQVPAHLLADGPDDQRGHEGTEVDAHVEDGEAAVAARVVRPVVQVADHRGDVGLQQAGADGDQAEAHEERGRGRHGQQEVAGHDDAAADGHRLARAPEAVGEPAARQGEQVEHRVVDAVDRGADGGGVPEPAVGGAGDQVEHQQGTHSVEAEAFPHLGHEERGKAPGVPEEGPAAGGRRPLYADVQGRRRHE